MDSLRYWVAEMHVDGFRFDLASTLIRELFKVDRLGAFFDIIHPDPVLYQVKLIAMPWDVGSGSYQVGNFPVLWRGGLVHERAEATIVTPTRAYAPSSKPWRGEDRWLRQRDLLCR
jgi:pullulanase/glycogen debranching enzyme